MKYAVGMVVRHRLLNFTGVIVSWNLSCTKSDDWIKRNGIRHLARGSDQPFYRVLVPGSATSHRYWPEGNLIRGNLKITTCYKFSFYNADELEMAVSPNEVNHAAFIAHFIGFHFERFDGRRYLPNAMVLDGSYNSDSHCVFRSLVLN